MTLHSVKYTAILAGAMVVTALLPVVSLAVPQASMSQNTMAATTILDQLQLSKAQKQNIQSLRAKRNQAILKILTPAQRTKLQQELKGGKKLSQALKDLGLNAKQKKDLMVVVQQSNQEMRGVLNAKQQQQLDAWRKQRQMAGTAPIE